MERKEESRKERTAAKKMKRKGIEIKDEGGGAKDKRSERITENGNETSKKDIASLRLLWVEETHLILNHWLYFADTFLFYSNMSLNVFIHIALKRETNC